MPDVATIVILDEGNETTVAVDSTSVVVSPVAVNIGSAGAIWGTITGTLSNQTDLNTALAGKASTSHTHDDRYYTETEVDTLLAGYATDLTTGLAGKANTSHTHAISDVTNLQTELDGKQASGDYATNTALTTGLAGKANTSHTHTKSDITDFAHTHPISEVTNLQTTLDGKAASSHTHAIADVTNLQTSLDGKAATSHTHAIADVTGLQTALDGKAASSHTHIIGDVTGLQTALDGKASTSHTHALDDLSDVTISSPATDHVIKYNGSAWVNGVAPGGGTIDATPTDGSSNAVSSNGVFDALALKANTSVLTNFSDPEVKIIQALGGTMKAQNMQIVDAGTSTNLTDGQVRWASIWLPEDATLTGAMWFQRTAGSFTADNENGVALYTYSGGTLTRVAISATGSGALWTTAANSYGSIAFTSTYAATAGLYFIAIIYNNSAQTTAPAITTANVANGNVALPNLTNSARLFGTTTSATLPATQAISGLAVHSTPAWLALY